MKKLNLKQFENINEKCNEKYLTYKTEIKLYDSTLSVRQYT